MTDRSSRIPGFHRLSLADRLGALVKAGYLGAGASERLLRGEYLLQGDVADRMVENTIGTFSLPFAAAPNFRVNGREYVVPMVVEEPSVVAGLSGAARLLRSGNGISSTSDDPLLIGQIQVHDAPASAAKNLEDAEQELLELANGRLARLVERGGGARDIQVRQLELPGGVPTIVLHIVIDTRDAMGANLVNTVCEALAPSVERISGGKVCLRILSNLADRSLVTAVFDIPVQALRANGYSGEQVRDGIVLANDLAIADPYRAATHNKGIMNGIDPVAIATGNDWRAIEASVHAYACRDGAYRSLTRWSVTSDGALRGELTVPLKVGIVGASLRSNPAANLALEIMGVSSATELAELMAAVGLVQNFAALRALVTSGIQKGHMSLHARSVVSAADAPEDIFDTVVSRLIESGEIKEWKAAEIIAEMSSGYGRPKTASADTAVGRAAGKVILFGEHAVVHGEEALAIPLPNAVTAYCTLAEGEGSLDVTTEGSRGLTIDRADSDGIRSMLDMLADSLGLTGRVFDVQIETSLPIGMGLGSSAALATALARAMALCTSTELDNERCNKLAFECEKIAHGQPSGIDNALSVYARPLLYSRTASPPMRFIEVPKMPGFVVAWGSETGSTLDQVAAVGRRYESDVALYGSLFRRIGAISRSGAEALADGRLQELGRLMNVCHGLLNAIGVSTPDLERMVAIARQAGAVGAKLTGAGGGGSIVALCAGDADVVETTLRGAGYQTLKLEQGTA